MMIFALPTRPQPVLFPTSSSLAHLIVFFIPTDCVIIAVLQQVQCRMSSRVSDVCIRIGSV